jgi:hypothetical protein
MNCTAPVSAHQTCQYSGAGLTQDLASSFGSVRVHTIYNTEATAVLATASCEVRLHGKPLTVTCSLHQTKVLP